MTTDRKYDPGNASAETGGTYASTRGMEGEAPRPFLVDTNAEELYWRENYSTRPYARDDRSFLEYKPAYRYGADAHARYPGRSFDEAEGDLRNDWDRFKGTSSLTWDEARHAARDAWQRVKDFMERAMPGDRDRDGK
ncbi:MAG TPA: hypothetical protein VFI92_10715 [Steroidobacteraceae bacterium]|nr:hypothetical protein [Steroidobacteraceae bacterium]